MARFPAAAAVAAIILALSSSAGHSVPASSTVGGGATARTSSPHDFGHSVRDQKLRAIRIGPNAPRRVLVVGSIHGDEREGHEVIRRLRRRADLDAALWTVKSVNPDGVDARTRVNARGVDLNRNFPYRWRADEAPGSGYYQGPGPASEPETRAVMRLIRELRPDVTIWYHQPWNQVLMPCRGRARVEKLYARVAHMPTKRCRGERLRGTATSWQEHRVAGTAFVVELHGGELSPAEVRRHARAVARVAGSVRR